MQARLPSKRRLDRRDDCFAGDAEIFIELIRWRRFTETIYADDYAFKTNVFAPKVGHTRFYRDPRYACGKNSIAITCFLPGVLISSDN